MKRLTHLSNIDTLIVPNFHIVLMKKNLPFKSSFNPSCYLKSQQISTLFASLDGSLMIKKY